MDESSIVYVFVVILLPILISIVALLYQMHKDTKDSQKESIEATSKLTAAMVKLTDKIDQVFADNEKQDELLEDHDKRISNLEHDVIVIQKDIEHYHNKKG